MSLKPLNRTQPSNQKGFTLLELMIAMAMLVVISLGVYQATVETFRLRDVLNNEGDFYNAIRLAMNIVQRDISLLYSPLNAVPPKVQSTSTTQTTNPSPGITPASAAVDKKLEALLTTDAGRSTQYWSPAIHMSGIRPARFVGTESKMTFVSLSHIRIYKLAPESEFSKISYEVRRDEQPNQDGSRSDLQMLVKTTSPNAFEEDEGRDKNKLLLPLLHRIKTLKFRYYFKEKDTWSTRWDSDSEDTRNKYPDLIELTVDVRGENNGSGLLSYDGIFKFRPEIPLHGLPKTL